jgi:hypothetical protein
MISSYIIVYPDGRQMDRKRRKLELELRLVQAWLDASPTGKSHEFIPATDLMLQDATGHARQQLPVA